MNKVIMISGASRGIGRVIALKLYEHGYFLSLGIRHLDKVDKSLSQLSSKKVLMSYYDATRPKTEQAWVTKTLNCFGRIDGLINNAGIFYSVDVEDVEDKLLAKMIDVNIKAPIRLTQSVLPYLRQSKEGRIVNVVSNGAKQVEDSKVGYSISKSGFLAASHAMLHAAKADGVRVTALCPGWVNTSMGEKYSGLSAEEMIQPETVAEIVLMLLRLPNTAVIPELVVNNTQ